MRFCKVEAPITTPLSAYSAYDTNYDLLIARRISR